MHSEAARALQDSTSSPGISNPPRYPNTLNLEALARLEPTKAFLTIHMYTSLNTTNYQKGPQPSSALVLLQISYKICTKLAVAILNSIKLTEN